ncbi:SOS response-associated peptidase [Chitinimonas sp. BJB300]|uniref:SOS response-associated peptidase n=1 Tax=Chitinimonas sp. BJB300 TaxID=1559339 RepID=UPI000C0D2EBF|nr:SOS response-associated peptidase family protein [Chitinimonas sp. BJB300]PHV09780.1 DUF159 family protein [Chitinimonas sp. BJB300]TSJ84635.1 SOS response-associated peptidase [Chitinimonas sp. BJB300]
MCTNFTPSDKKIIYEMFDVPVPDVSFKRETFPGYLAPIVRRSQEGASGSMECIAANFGLIPPWAKDKGVSRKTYNARTETVGEKPSFRHAWKARQFCLVPMSCFFEPNYVTGKPVRWRIENEGKQDFAAAGIWESWKTDGHDEMSFSLLTINADGHALMGQFHKPGDEKRSLVIVPPNQYSEWLTADAELARTFLSLSPLENFSAQAAPKQPHTLDLF